MLTFISNNGEECANLNNTQRVRFAKNIQEASVKLQVQLPALSSQLGFTARRFLDVVNNRSKTVPVRLLQEAADFFGVSVNDLLGKLPEKKLSFSNDVRFAGSEVLRVWRLRRGLTQKEIAVKFNLSPREVSLLERGVSLDDRNLQNKVIRFLAPTQAIGEAVVNGWTKGFVVAANVPYGLKEIKKSRAAHAHAN